VLRERVTGALNKAQMVAESSRKWARAGQSRGSHGGGCAREKKHSRGPSSQSSQQNGSDCHAGPSCQRVDADGKALLL
jgi:hypothetical protein